MHFAMFATSSSVRVTSEEVEKRRCPRTRNLHFKEQILTQVLASPTEAVAAKRGEDATGQPRRRQSGGDQSQAHDGLRDTPSSASTSETMVSGTRHSRITSPMMNKGVRIAGALNSRSRPSTKPDSLVNLPVPSFFFPVTRPWRFLSVRAAAIVMIAFSMARCGRATRPRFGVGSGCAEGPGPARQSDQPRSSRRARPIPRNILADAEPPDRYLRHGAELHEASAATSTLRGNACRKGVAQE